MIRTAFLKDLDYPTALKVQLDAVTGIETGDTEIVYGIEHAPCITLGRRSRGLSEELKDTQIPIYSIQRGGLATYHGPGQLTVYPIIKIDRYGLGVRRWVELLESVTISLLLRYGVQAQTKEGYPGVWTVNGKIASIGLQIKNGISMHGLSLNTKAQFEGFHLINPCGIENINLSSLESEIGRIIPATLLFEELTFDLKNTLSNLTTTPN